MQETTTPPPSVELISTQELERLLRVVTKLAERYDSE